MYKELSQGGHEKMIFQTYYVTLYQIPKTVYQCDINTSVYFNPIYFKSIFIKPFSKDYLHLRYTYNNQNWLLDSFKLLELSFTTTCKSFAHITFSDFKCKTVTT